MQSVVPNTFYRVSVKALVQGGHNTILVVKESQDAWSLPGGGLDHGEDPLACLKRELHEELAVTQIGTANLYTTTTFYLKERQTWLLWLVYTVELELQHFKLGKGVTDALFIDPESLQHSGDVFEQAVYTAAKERAL